MLLENKIIVPWWTMHSIYRQDIVTRIIQERS